MAKTRPTTGKTFIQRSREASPEFKALIHEELGAGRARVRRPFFQLTAADEEAIWRELDRRVTFRLTGA